MGGIAASGAAWAISSRFGYAFRPSLKLGSLNTIDNDEPFDVCIVGSGPAGVVLGLELANRGFRTLILESGERVDRRQNESRVEKLEAYRSSGPIQYPVLSTRFRGLGGTSNLWSGNCPRLYPLDFQNNAYTPKDAGWPITFQELEPYYKLAEETLRVSESPSADTSSLKLMMREVGITVDDNPRKSVGLNGGGPIRVSRDLLPSFVESQNAELISGATASQLLPDSSGNIVGLEVQGLDGGTSTVRARVYVVACGALETARLLLLSRSQAFPDGIGNRYGVVGRYFMEHPRCVFFGKIPHRDFHGIGRCHQFYEEFKHQGLGSVLLSIGESGVEGDLRISANVELLPSRANRVTLAHGLEDYFGNPGVDLSLHFTDEDSATLDQARSLIRTIYADLGAEDVREGGMAWSHHHMGCCRMGDDPKTSVTDRNLRAHESPNLYLAGSAVFVTGGASNPTLTIAALSHRLADHLTVILNKPGSTYSAEAASFAAHEGLA